MVHRPADSRLLANLLQQEKEYVKQLNQVLDSSNVSLASFGAYAAASPRPASQVIMSVAGSLAAADEALRRYVHGVEEWRDSMRALKDAEEEVGNIMRDREILVTRLIKASKSHKSGSSNFRDSLLLGNQQFPSSSSLSSSFIGQQDSPSPSPSRPLSAAFSSSKLAAAQTELQACETHLAAKEHELDTKRNAAIRDGLGARAKAMMECGWAWSQLGKDALHALEELKPENLERRASTYMHETYLGDTLPIHHENENADPHSTRPSFDFSSIGPSQSASQVNVNNDDLPPPVHIGSIMNSGIFGEPSAKQNITANAGHPNSSNNITETQLPPPHDPSSGARPPSGISTTASSVSATPATYKVETVTYAPAVAVHVPGRDAAGPSTPHPPLSSELFKDDHAPASSHAHAQQPEHQLHSPHAAVSVHIPAPHALEGYAFDIPTATATPERQPVASPSSSSSGQKQQQQQQGHREQSSSSRSRSATPSTSGRSTPQMQTPAPVPGAASPAVYVKRHVLERRITEEEMRRTSEDTQRGGDAVPLKDDDDADSSTEEELEVGKKMVEEGKLEVVENPRFLSEARRRELEREEERRVKAREEEGKTKEKEKKRFLFFHSSSHSHSQITSVSTAEQQQQGNGRVAFAPDDDTDAQHTPKSTTANASPSKGFFGSIKGLFGGSKNAKDGPSSSPTRTRQKIPPSSSAVNIVDDNADVDSSDDEAGRSPTSRSAGGLTGLFRGKEKEKGTSSKWETRTDRNIQQLAQRGSLDDGSVGRRAGGVGLSSALGGALAGRAVANAGVVSASEVRVGRAPGSGGAPRTRAASDVGVAVGAGAAGRKLKKNRVGAGPPVAPSASAVALTGDDRASVGSVDAAATPTSSRPAPAKSVGAKSKTPTRAASTSVAPGNRVKGVSGTRRSASVDVGPARRKSWVEDEENEGEGVEEGLGGGGGRIVDLGWRRTASEVGVSPPPAPVARPVVPSVKPFQAVIRTTPTPPAAKMPPTATTTPVTKEYSSDTAAMAAAPAVARKKSLTKKKPQPSAAPSVPPPVQVVSSAVPLAALVREDAATPPTTPAPARKSSMKAPATPGSSPLAAKTSPAGGATILTAGGEHPSGTLVSQPGWKEQAQTMGGGLSRNSSVVSSASAPSGPGGAGGGSRGKRPTSLGQGMGGSGGLGRRSSLGGSSQVSGMSGGGGSKADAGGPVVQATPAVPSLMSIVEDVARANREGWSHDAKVQKSVGGTQKPTALIEVVKAPVSLGRDELRAMDVAQIKAVAAGHPPTVSSMASASASTLTLTGTGTGARVPLKTAMFEIKAPGSVFEQRAYAVGMAREASASAPTLIAGPAQTTTTSTTPKKDQRPQARVAASGMSGQVRGPAKTPLRSAMRTSRSPSPAVGGVVPPPVRGALPWDSDRAGKKNVKDKGKGKAPVRPAGGEVEDSGDGSDDSESYETGNEFYSDLEEVGKIIVVPASSSTAASSSQATLKTTTTTTMTTMNGRIPAQYGSPKGAASDVSHSTTSTIPGGSALHTPSSGSQPRRRKSVRVSLQPTFSPSPPAIEYESDEERRMFAPWGGSSGSGGHGWQEERNRRYTQPDPLPAPVPVRAAAVSPVTAVVGVSHQRPAEVRDMWQDSGSDEDEEYVRAKRLLTRAAKKEKDVNLLVANRA